MSIAWFTRLYRLNEAGRFDEAVTASKRFLVERPKDYALHLQRAKALLSLGRLDEAGVHLDAAVKWSKGLAAWPWFYLAALHARLGRRVSMYEALDTALRLDPRLEGELAQSPFFAAYWSSRAFKARVRPSRPSSRRASTPSTAGSPSPPRAPGRARTARSAPHAEGRGKSLPRRAGS